MILTEPGEGGQGLALIVEVGGEHLDIVGRWVSCDVGASHPKMQPRGVGRTHKKCTTGHYCER